VLRTTRGGQCTSPTHRSSPLLSRPPPPKVAPVPVASHRHHLLLLHVQLLGSLVFTSFFLFFLRYPLHSLERLWLLHSLCTHLFIPTTKHTSIGYHTSLASPTAALIIPRSVSTNSTSTIHPSLHQDHREHAATVITRFCDTFPITSETRPPARVKRSTTQPAPIANNTATKLPCRPQTDPPSSYPRPIIPKMSFKYLAPVVAIAAGRVAGKRRFANNKLSLRASG